MEKGSQIEGLNLKLAGANETEKAALRNQIAKLDEEKGEARKAELRAIEWKPLWGKPAMFAAGVFILFVLLFRNPKLSQAAVASSQNKPIHSKQERTAI